MAFMDDFSKKLSQTADKTKNLAQIADLNTCIDEAEKKIQALYLAIGKKYYADHTADAEPDLAQMVADITAAQETIARCREEINELNGMVRCPGCNILAKKEALYCTACGTRMPRESQSDNHCEKCGAPLEEGQKFCQVCGTRVGEEPAQSAPVTPPAPVKTCSGCGAVLQEGQKFCVDCGMRLENIVEEPAVTTEKVEENIPAPVENEPKVENCAKTCVACGAVLSEDQLFCVVCGTKIEATAQEIPAFCTHCGRHLEEGALFCVGCGAKVQ